MSKIKDGDVTRCRGCGQWRLVKDTGTACLICSIYITEHSTSFAAKEESKVCDPVYNRAVLRSIINETDNYSKTTAQVHHVGGEMWSGPYCPVLAVIDALREKS